MKNAIVCVALTVLLTIFPAGDVASKLDCQVRTFNGGVAICYCSRIEGGRRWQRVYPMLVCRVVKSGGAR